MSEHKCPTPPFTSTNEKHAGDANEFAPKEDPCPDGFIVHNIEYGDEMTVETADSEARIA